MKRAYRYDYAAAAARVDAKIAANLPPTDAEIACAAADGALAAAKLAGADSETIKKLEYACMSASFGLFGDGMPVFAQLREALDRLSR